jgi:hypothetical protein
MEDNEREIPDESSNERLYALWFRYSAGEHRPPHSSEKEKVSW